MKSRRLLSVFVFCMASVAGESATTPGAQFFYLGMGARQFALAGSASAAYGCSTEDIYFNPAALAYNEQLRIGLNWGAIGTDNQYAGLTGSWLLDRGVLTLSGAYSGYRGDGTSSTGTGLFFRGAFSKRITPTFLFGIGMTAAGALPEPEKKFRPGIAADIGMILLGSNPVFRKQLPEGLSFSNFSFGFSLLNLGLNPDTASARPFPDPSIKIGTGFTFLHTEYMDLRLQSDLTMAFNDRSFRYGLGLDTALFGILHLRSGLHLGNTDLGPVTLGASVKPDALMGDNPLELSWAYVPVRFNGGRKEHAHFFSLNFTLGGIDRTPPEVKFTSHYPAFSPNGDGIQDTVPFSLDVRDNRILKGWKIMLYNSNGNLVRTLSNTNRSSISSFKGFFKKLFAREGSIDSPSAWAWDGKDADGKRVPDGTYSYRASAVDANGNTGFSEKRQIIVDTTPPGTDVTVSPLLFSPDGDGRLDLTVISNITTGPEKSWTGEITGPGGRILRTWVWQVSPPPRIEWDGRDKKGNVVKDGAYHYRLTGTDPAGNSFRRSSSRIIISTKHRRIRTSSERAAFSPNGDGDLDTVRFTHRLPRSPWFLYWEFTIKDTNGLPVRKIWSSRHPAPPFVWNGTDRYGNKVPDGIYRYTLHAAYRDGDLPVSRTGSIRIDNTPPTVGLKLSPLPFSPDADGYNDRLRIRVSINDNSPVKNWTLTIRKGKTVFKTFRGDGRQGKRFNISWDGQGDRKGETVESATGYNALLTVTDILGNTGRSKIVPLEVDILLIRTPRGLRIRISNIEFIQDGRRLKHLRDRTLDRIAAILKRYADHKVFIEDYSGRTDNNRLGPMLSTLRARTVLRYLSRMGIDEDRMLARGSGTDSPAASGSAGARRIEFILVKED